MKLNQVISRARKKAERDGVLSLVINTPGWLYSKANERMTLRSPILVHQQNSSFSYQMNRIEGVQERWEILEPRLNENASVLDIGCNAALLTSKVGATDRFAIGLEANTATVEDAVQYHGLSREFGIINKPITPKNVHSLPTFDYIFFFSIYHQLYSHYGKETAEELLFQLSEKASDTLFFEAASQKSKYDDQSLPFKDFDKNSIVEYNIDMLESVTRNSASVEYIGHSSRKNEKGDRHLFSVE